MLTQPFWEVWSTPHCGRQLLLRWSAASSRKPKITKRQSKKFAKVVENAKVTLFLQAESLTSCKLLFRLIISLAIRLNWFTWIFFCIEQAPWKIMNILQIMNIRHTMCHVMIYLEHLFLLCFLVRRNCHRFSHLARLSSLFMHHLPS